MRGIAWLVVVAAAVVALTGCLDPGGLGSQDHADPSDERIDQLRGILWMGRTASVDVVVHAQSGYEPGPAAVTAVEEQASRLVGKPVRVVVRVEDYAFPEDVRWDAGSLDAVREPALAEPWPEGVALVHAFALPGCYEFSEERPCIRGISGRTATILVRGDEGGDFVHLNSQPLARDVPLVGWYHEERYLYVHELGHVFGLVASPLDQVQERLSSNECLCHSVDPDSVMASDGRGWSVRINPQDPTEILETVAEDSFQRYQYSDRDIEDVRAFQATEPGRDGRA